MLNHLLAVLSAEPGTRLITQRGSIQALRIRRPSPNRIEIELIDLGTDLDLVELAELTRQVEQAAQPVPPAAAPLVSRPVVCAECGKCYAYHSGLAKHRRTAHPSPEERPDDDTDDDSGTDDGPGGGTPPASEPDTPTAPPVAVTDVEVPGGRMTLTPPTVEGSPEPVSGWLVCTRCGRRYAVRGMAKHLRACLGPPDSDITKVPCAWCGKPIKPRGMHLHARKCPQRPGGGSEDAADDGDSVLAVDAPNEAAAARWAAYRPDLTPAERAARQHRRVA